MRVQERPFSLRGPEQKHHKAGNPTCGGAVSPSSLTLTPRLSQASLLLLLSGCSSLTRLPTPPSTQPLHSLFHMLPVSYQEPHTGHEAWISRPPQKASDFPSRLAQNRGDIGGAWAGNPRIE